MAKSKVGWDFFNQPGSTGGQGGSRLDPKTFGTTQNSIPAIDQIGPGAAGLASTTKPTTGSTSAAMSGRNPFVDKVMRMTDIEFQKLMQKLGHKNI